MSINLAGTTGAVKGCTLVTATDYPKPTPNPGGSDLPQVPSVPRRKLALDCSNMTVALNKIKFTYQDSQAPAIWYDAWLQLNLAAFSADVKAEALFQDMQPAA